MSQYRCKSRAMNSTFLRRLLERYNSGKASKAERFIVDRWYDSFEDYGDLTPGIETPEKALYKEEKMFLKITGAGKAVRLWYMRPGFQIAASLLIITMISLFFYVRNRSQEDFLVYRTEKGKTQRLTLPDSTVVWLNSGTELKVMNGYGKAFRKVALKGEAYFEVRHNKSVPFMITTGKLNTQVLGTSFNVSAYNNLPCIEVVVRTGKVSVSKGADLLGTLMPGKAILYNKQSGSSAFSEQDAETRISWRSGRIMLDHASFQELAERFGNTFNVRLVSKDKKIQGLIFRLMLDKTMSLEENINIITDIHQLKYRRINAHEIELYSK